MPRGRSLSRSRARSRFAAVAPLVWALLRLLLDEGHAPPIVVLLVVPVTAPLRPRWRVLAAAIVATALLQGLG